MASDFPCPSCRAVLDPAAIDRERDIATCGNCGRLVDLRAAPPTATGATASSSSAAARTRPVVQLPDGMTVSVKTGGAGLTIRRRWLRGKHWVMLLAFAAVTVVIAHFWLTQGSSTWLVIATLLVASWNYNLLCMFVDQTVVSATHEGVDVRHGPLPSPFGLRRTLRKRDIRQLYAAKHGGLFSVRAQLATDGTNQMLVAPLVTSEQALFVEQQLELALGIVDVPIEGELGADQLAGASGRPPRGARSGAALALVIPLIIAATLGMFFIVARSEVKGSLRGTADGAAWELALDDCYSGQREGFGGVVLTAEEDVARQVRVVEDPVKGTLVVVAATGRPNLVVEAVGCKRFDVAARRTSTNINDIWVVEGRLDVDCAQLSGSVTFAGCH